MRAEHRVYSHVRAARFRSGDKQLVLRAPDSFKLFADKKRPYIVKDGVVYHFPSKAISELRARSQVVKPTKDFAARDTLLDTVGLDVANDLNTHLTKTLLPTLQPYSPSEPKYGVLNGRAFFEIEIGLPEGVATVGFFQAHTVVGFAVYAPKNWDYTKWPAMPKLQQQARKFAKYLETQDGVIAAGFKVVKSSVSNVRTPSGKPFSGTIVSYLTNWTRP